MTKQSLVSQQFDPVQGNLTLKLQQSSSTNSCLSQSLQISDNLENNDEILNEKKQNTSYCSSNQLSTKQRGVSPNSSKLENEVYNNSSENFVYRIKNLEAKNLKLLFENGCLIKDLNSNLANIQFYKHQVIQLKKDNNELRDLCCYLDDERNRSRAIAQEWTSFGAHMSDVMKKEIKNYSQKLSQLENKQFELVKENFELKQLCLLLDNAMSTQNLNEKNISLNEKNIALNENKLVDFDKNKMNKDHANEIINQSLDERINKNLDEKVNKSLDETKINSKSLLNKKILNYISLIENKLNLFDLELKKVYEKLSDINQIKLLEDLKLLSIDNNEILNNRPIELKKAFDILSIEKSIDEEESYSQSNKNNIEQNTENCFVNDEQKLIIKHLCSAALKKIENE